MNRLAALAVPMFLAAAGPAAAQVDYIVTDPFLEEGSSLDLRMVRSSQDGIVRVLDPLTEQIVAETPVNAGANRNVRMRFRLPLMHDAVALLYHGDIVVAQRRLNIVDGDSPFFDRDDD